MIFVNQTMFTGNLHIPNLDEKCIQDIEILKMISKYERAALEFALGKCLMDELLENMEIAEVSSGVNMFRLKEDADDKWKWLVNGRTYTKEDEEVDNFLMLSEGCGCAPKGCDKHIWEGFVTTTPSFLDGAVIEFQESFLADYVYFMWAHFNISRTTGVGEQIPDSKNSTNHTNKKKRIDAFNSFWAKVRHCSKGGRIGLHGFLREHGALYPNFESNCFEPLNYYDV